MGLKLPIFKFLGFFKNKSGSIIIVIIFMATVLFLNIKLIEEKNVNKQLKQKILEQLRKEVTVKHDTTFVPNYVFVYPKKNDIDFKRQLREQSKIKLRFVSSNKYDFPYYKTVGNFDDKFIGIKVSAWAKAPVDSFNFKYQLKPSVVPPQIIIERSNNKKTIIFSTIAFVAGYYFGNK